MKYKDLFKNKSSENNDIVGNLSILTETDRDYYSIDIVNYIAKDLNKKLIVDGIHSNENELTIKTHDLGKNEYLIIVNKPRLRAEGAFYKYYYDIDVTLNKQDNEYIDYNFNLDKRIVDNKEKQRLLTLFASKKRIINGNVTIITKCYPSYSDNKIDYVVVKDSLKLEVNTRNTKWRIEALLQKLSNFDLIEIYNLIKDLDKNLVVDLSIRITNEELKSVEELSIYNGNITNYRKKYYDNDILVSIDYRDGKLVKNTELIVDDIDNQKITDFDVNESIVKVKRLSK